MHTRIKHPCDRCGETFVTETRMKLHLKNHDTDRGGQKRSHPMNTQVKVKPKPEQDQGKVDEDMIDTLETLAQLIFANDAKQEGAEDHLPLP